MRSIDGTVRLSHLRRGVAVGASLALALALAVPQGGGASIATGDLIERVSLSTAGAQANQSVQEPDPSGDGRYVAFATAASNVVAGDSNADYDVFVRDRATATTSRVSVDTAGGNADDGSYGPSISADGRYVAFYSLASDLVSGDTGRWDVFVRDRSTSTTSRVSMYGVCETNGNSFGAEISADGVWVAFVSDASDLVLGDTNGALDVFVGPPAGGTNTRVSISTAGAQANGASSSPSISADGRWVAFESSASNLVAGDGNGASDVFLRDRIGGTTWRISLDRFGGDPNGGSYAEGISPDGRFVSFRSYASDLVAGDTNGTVDVFVYDRSRGSVERASVDRFGGDSNGESASSTVSDEGIVAFQSGASDLVPGDTNAKSDIFARDMLAGVTARVSADTLDGNANNVSYDPGFAFGGTFVTFQSAASDLVAGDTNAQMDGFLAALPPFGSGPAVAVSGSYLPIAGDFDGNGADDLFWYAPGTAKDSLWWGGPDGYTSDPTPPQVQGTYTPIAGDFSGDFRTDLLWYAPGAGAEHLWYADPFSPTHFVAASVTAVNGTYTPLTGNFDGDFFVDIFWYAPGAAPEFLWRGGGVAGFVASPALPVVGTYTPVVGDFDGDGYHDVLWYAPGAATDNLWRGALGGFAPVVGAPQVVGTYVPIAGDYDGDGRADVYWYAPGAGTERHWRGTWSSFATAHAFQVSGTYTPIPSDGNGDGHDDLLWYAPGAAADHCWCGFG